MMSDRESALAFAIIASVTMVRIAVLSVSPLELYPDEAQYWFWSLTPDFGYYSKPPLIAWVIGATTALFGDGEWAVRLGAPLLHGATALALFAAARAFGAPRGGLLIVCLWLAMPGVGLGSFVITTDTPMVLAWAVALFALAKLRDRGGYGWALAMGAAIGLGLNAKYAMAYVFAGLALAALADPATRRVVLSPRFAAVLAAAALLIAPNLIWNAGTGFVTLGHTADNADWGNADFNPTGALEFLGAQFAVAGPLALVLMLIAGVAAFTRPWAEDRGAARALALLAAPPLAVVTVQGIISDANANWAVASYVPGTILLALWAGAGARRLWAWGAAGLNALIAAVLALGLAVPALADGLGQSNALKRMRGWEAAASWTRDLAARTGAAGILVENRSLTAALVYYARDGGVPIHAFDADGRIEDHFEMVLRLPDGARGPFLAIATRDDPRGLDTRFAEVGRLETEKFDLGGGRTRSLTAFLAGGPPPD